ncbi:hypothetical protein F5J12DRAFT_727745 [Pisolithus orientalis]|uniref:uncharacterized protein n=1 Tax=Pisolithus orientalis TaxID=936130 RepID=UPI0022245270|nr:uncharacterized protein F5J12DRAFT_727745 [Pisolithus orientalis]KAI5990035.1 hypothetical protein F5J12DRAFT_727745 [Pisolithus orientalis]
MIDKWSLCDNAEQRCAFTIITEHMLQDDLQQLLIFLTRIGGSGKSHVIWAVVDTFMQ